MKILFLANSYTSPSSRFRIWQFVDPLRLLGHEVVIRVTEPTRDWVPHTSISFLRNLLSRFGSVLRLINAIWITRDIEKFDIVMMNRDLLPGIHLSTLEPWLCKRNPHFIFDFDDSIHLSSRATKLKRILPNFGLLTVGNTYLAEYAKNVNGNIAILPTVIDSDKYQPRSERATGPIRIGWSGSKSTLQHCLPLLEGVITKLAQSVDFEFIVIADSQPKFNWHINKLRFIKWTPETEVEGLQQIDIGLMPLRNEPFERGKCGLKAIQYMGVGIPTLVSPVGVNTEIVRHGKDGFVCETESEWLEYLMLLVNDDILRDRMGICARLRVVEHYSIQSLLPKMVCEFERLSAR